MANKEKYKIKDLSNGKIYNFGYNPKAGDYGNVVSQSMTFPVQRFGLFTDI